jgi:FKBP-type peptidyl-prolyl cis-trans isomerase
MTRAASVGIFLLLLLPLSLLAQCDKCPQIPGDLSDYCYSNPDFPGRCARLTQDSQEFWFQDINRKKTQALKLAMPDLSKTTLDQYLLMLAADKAAKWTSADLLFLRNALSTWDAMEVVRKFDLARVNEDFTLLPSGLAYRLLVRGTGKMPQPGKMVNVHYTGRLADGTKFDSSLDRKQTYGFMLGAKKVIAGWDEGIALFPVGSRVLLRVPPELGYGAKAIGTIPPKSVLYFEVEIISAE